MGVCRCAPAPAEGAAREHGVAPATRRASIRPPSSSPVSGSATRTSVWDNVHIRGPATIGHDCIIGEKTYIAYGVEIGNFVKINAKVYIRTGVTIDDRVMIAAGVIFTNDRYPRAFDDGVERARRLRPDRGHAVRTTSREGATIGAGARIGPGVTIGAYAMVGMGAVVTTDVPAHGLVIGNPARLRGWVCVCGRPLPSDDAGRVCCPAGTVAGATAGRTERTAGWCTAVIDLLVADDRARLRPRRRRSPSRASRRAASTARPSSTVSVLVVDGRPARRRRAPRWRAQVPTVVIGAGADGPLQRRDRRAVQPVARRADLARRRAPRRADPCRRRAPPAAGDRYLAPPDLARHGARDVPGRPRTARARRRAARPAGVVPARSRRRARPTCSTESYLPGAGDPVAPLGCRRARPLALYYRAPDAVRRVVQRRSYARSTGICAASARAPAPIRWMPPAGCSSSC